MSDRTRAAAARGLWSVSSSALRNDRDLAGRSRVLASSDFGRSCHRAASLGLSNGHGIELPAARECNKDRPAAARPGPRTSIVLSRRDAPNEGLDVDHVARFERGDLVAKNLCEPLHPNGMSTS
jgi:hypothetical protein